MNAKLIILLALAVSGCSLPTYTQVYTCTSEAEPIVTECNGITCKDANGNYFVPSAMCTMRRLR